MSGKNYGFRTAAVHAGKTIQADTGALAVPIYSTSSFGYGDFDSGERRFSGSESGFIYSRFANPTVKVFEDRMAFLEGGDQALACSSGMAAISSALFGLLSAGDEMIYVGTLYGGTLGVMQNLLTRMGVVVRGVKDVNGLRDAMTEKIKLVFIETPSNPTLEIIEIELVATLAKKFGAITIADNTFATPYLTNPIALGIDIVIHSATKYIGGHGDATGGIVIGKHEHIEKIRTVGVKQLGGCMSPNEAFMLIRGLKTLPLRMDAICESAQQVANFLHQHPSVERVFYPGLKSHPGYKVASAQMKNFGGVLSFELRGDRQSARRFLDGLKVITQAVSVGDVDSLACHPDTTTHSSVPVAIRRKQGVTENLIRLSVGIEDIKDINADIDSALAALPS